MKKCIWQGCLLLLALFSACKKESVEKEMRIETGEAFTQPEILSQQLRANPSGYAPLTAVLEIATKIPTRLSVRVVGKHGPASDVTVREEAAAHSHSVTILGLYGNYNNILELVLYDQQGKRLGSSAVFLETPPLHPDLPSVTINTSLPAKKAGMTLVSYFGNSGTAYPQEPFIFDEFGDIRWYLDFAEHPVLNELNYENGMERLKNGNLYFGDSKSSAIYEISMLGEVLNSWPMPGFTFHHQVLEKPNGNFIAAVDKIGATTIEDQLIEIDRAGKQIVRVWDLRQALQDNRVTMGNNLRDWLHVNAIWYDASDNTVIVSGRTQGAFKVDQNNQVKWLLAPHKDWGLAGDGTDLNALLLHPVDANGQPITDVSVLDGTMSHPDFEWNWYQHAVKLMPNGHLALFDNGDDRNYVALGPYSRAVEYEIDPVAMTVKQIWQYGKQLGVAGYSRIVSDVDYLPEADHFIFSPGAQSNVAGKYGKVIEVARGSSTVLFEATIKSPATSAGLVTFHRTERLSLYRY